MLHNSVAPIEGHGSCDRAWYTILCHWLQVYPRSGFILKVLLSCPGGDRRLRSCIWTHCRDCRLGEFTAMSEEGQSRLVEHNRAFLSTWISIHSYLLHVVYFLISKIDLFTTGHRLTMEDIRLIALSLPIQHIANFPDVCMRVSAKTPIAFHTSRAQHECRLGNIPLKLSWSSCCNKCWQGIALTVKSDETYNPAIKFLFHCRG